MFKFAFLINVPGVSPETYFTVYETNESYSIVAGVDGMEAAKEYMKQLLKKDIKVFDLCGDFDDETTDQMREIAGEGITIRHAEYNLNEMAKLNMLKSFRNYGVIVKADGTGKSHEVVLRSKACDSRIIFVENLAEARKAARRLVEKRVNFIELCSWFDILRLDSIVAAIDGKVPVGTCAGVR